MKVLNVFFLMFYRNMSFKFGFLINFFSKYFFSSINLNLVLFDVLDMGYDFLILFSTFFDLGVNKLPMVFKVKYKYRLKRQVRVLIIKTIFLKTSSGFKFLIREFFFFFFSVIFFKNLINLRMSRRQGYIFILNSIYSLEALLPYNTSYRNIMSKKVYNFNFSFIVEIKNISCSLENSIDYDRFFYRLFLLTCYWLKGYKLGKHYY